MVKKTLEKIMNKIHNKKYWTTLILTYFIFTFFFTGYNPYQPTLPFYPNNKKEIILVKKYIKNRTQQDINFFYKTNESVVNAFYSFVNESKNTLNKIITSKKVRSIILINKYLINRARPQQIDNSILPLNIDTAQTPAYPAGHAFQAYVLYHL